MTDDMKLSISRVSDEDIEQEVALLKIEYDKNPLKGTPRPSKKIIRQKLEAEIGEPTFAEQPINSTSVQFEDNREGRMESIAGLIDWAKDKGEETQLVIIAFLDDPSEHNLKITINRLEKLGHEIATRVEPEKQKPSLAEMIKRQLKLRREMSLDELYSLAIKSHVSKRPYAAVRQTLRRFEEQGLVRYNRDLQFITWKRGEPT